MTSTFCTGTITRHTNRPTVGSNCSVERLGATRDDSGTSVTPFGKVPFPRRSGMRTALILTTTKWPVGSLPPARNKNRQEQPRKWKNYHPTAIHADAWESTRLPGNSGFLGIGVQPRRTCASYDNDTHTRKTLNISALGTRGHARNLRNPKASCLVS